MIRTLAAAAAATALALAAPAQAQTGQSLYNLRCAGCHGSNPGLNTKNILGGKDWAISKQAMDTQPEMRAELRPLFDMGLLTDEHFQLIASYLQTFPGGVSAQLAMPAAINFGSVAVGVGSSIQSRSIALTAGSNAAVQLASTVTSSNPLEFVITSTTCTAGTFVLPATAGCSVSVQFTPATSGARSGSIQVSSNGIGSPQSFAVSGTGGSAPPPPPPPPPTGSLNVPSSFNFGSVNVGAQSLAQAIVLTNTSGTSVTVSNVTVGPSSDFALSVNLCGTVPNGGNCSILVVFNPSQAGTRNGTVSITSNGSGSPQSVALSGTGVGTTPPPPPPSPSKVTVVEYFHAVMGHYFVTPIAAEIAVLDVPGAHGWTRTGQSFQGYASATAGAVTVHRFFTANPAYNGKSSHFYTGLENEYNVLVTPGSVWGLEGDGFYVALPIGSTCPAAHTPVYRVYNSGQSGAPNHRFTTSPTIYTDFVNNKGYAGEGIVFCAPN